MKILVLNGSPRPKGNTTALSAAFAEGATGAGHEVEVANVGRMKFGGCLGCEYCHKAGNGVCVQKDEMAELLPKLKEAEMVVLASPIYYWSFSGQLQAAISRFYAIGKPTAKKYAMLLSSGSPGVYDAPVSQYHSMVGYFGGEDLGAHCFPGDADEAALAKVRAFGAGL